jgi:meiotic recombination protein SPO11
MTENDIKTGKELLNEEFIKKNKAWTKELEIMVSVRGEAIDFSKFFMDTSIP